MRITNVWIENDRLFIAQRINGARVIKAVSDFKPFILIDRKNLHHRTIEHLQETNKIRSTNEDSLYAKLNLAELKDYKWIRDVLEQNDIRSYESDLHLTRQYLVENEIDIGNEKLKYLFIDIETDDTARKIDVGAYPILSIGCLDMNGNKRFFLNQDYKDPKEERKMLLAFIDLVKMYDVIIGWNADNFDFPYLIDRSRLLNIYFNWRQIQKIDLMRKFMSVKGMKSYALDYVGKHELGMGKVQTGMGVTELYLKDKSKLMEYNMQDVELLFQLNKKYEMLEYMDVMSSKTKCMVEELQYPTAVVDNCILNKIREIGSSIRFPYKPTGEKKKYTGGFVMKPIAGLHKNIIVLDFTSLYNRIMQLGISPETVREFMLKRESHTSKEDLPYWFADYMKWLTENKKQPILQLILKELETERTKYKNLRNEHRKGSKDYRKYNQLQMAAKVVLLAFYGVMGNPSSRYYDNDTAAAITGVARYFIKKSIEFVTGKGFNVIYTDTDSIFIVSKETDLDKIIAEGTKITEELNVYYDTLLEKLNVPKESRRIEMKFEKVNEQIIFLGSAEKSKSKRYAGIQVWEEGKKIEPRFFAVGIEIVRTDWSSFAQEIQKKVIQMIFAGKSKQDIISYIVERKQVVMSGKLNKDNLIISQRLTKPINQYIGKTQHTGVARRMIEKGEEVWTGQKIQMIFVKGEKKEKGIPISDFKGEYAETYYWNNKIYPATERIVSTVFPKHKWSLLRATQTPIKNQKTLSVF